MEVLVFWDLKVNYCRVVYILYRVKYYENVEVVVYLRNGGG